MGSVDGRILVDRWSQPYGEASMQEILNVYRETGRSLNTDAWTFGKNTITEIFPERFNSEIATPLTDGDQRVFKAHRSSDRMFISVDPDADILYPTNTLRGDDILAVIGEKASQEYLGYLRGKGVSYIVVDDICDLKAAFEAINLEFGVNSVSLQGGGVFDGAMLADGLIDELSYVVYPGIDGTADSVSIFHYIGKDNGSPATGLSLQLLSAEAKAGGAVWLRYKVHAE